MNNINELEKLTIECLINPAHYKKYFKNDTETDIEFLNDKKFYRKRIINCMKEMFNGNFPNKSSEDNFNIYIKTIILYLKELDYKEILQEDYKDLSDNLITERENLKNNNKFNQEKSDNLLYREQKKKINTIDNFVKHKNEEIVSYALPEKKDINLKDPKFKKKGLPKKEKYSNNINEN